MKSDKDELFIKIVELNEMYHFLLDMFFVKKHLEFYKVFLKF